MPLAIVGVLPAKRVHHDSHDGNLFEAPTPPSSGARKVGGVAVQGFALAGLIPTLGGAALALVVPMAAALVARAGRETRGRSLRELEVG